LTQIDKYFYIKLIFRLTTIDVNVILARIVADAKLGIHLSHRKLYVKQETSYQVSIDAT